MKITLTDVRSAKGWERAVLRFDLARWQEDDPYRRTRGPRPTLAQSTRDARRHHRLFLVKRGRTFIGLAMVHKNNEVGVALLPQYRGRGNGHEAMRLVLACAKPLRGGKFRARIHPLNFRSVRLFEGLGFRHTDNIYTLNP